MIKTLRLAQFFGLSFALSFVACNKDDEKEKDEEETTKGKSGDSDDSESDSGDSDSDGKKTTSEGESDSGESDSDGTTGDDTGGGKVDLKAMRAVFEKECEGCHGTDGEGNKSFKTESMVDGKVKDWDDDKIQGVIEDGVSGTVMMAFSDELEAKEIEGLVKLIRCFQTEDKPEDCGK